MIIRNNYYSSYKHWTVLSNDDRLAFIQEGESIISILPTIEPMLRSYSIFCTISMQES